MVVRTEAFKNLIRSCKINCLFCVKKKSNLYARGRKAQHGMKKSHKPFTNKNVLGPSINYVTPKLAIFDPPPPM